MANVVVVVFVNVLAVISCVRIISCMVVTVVVAAVSTAAVGRSRRRPSVASHLRPSEVRNICCGRYA